jgi:hypothetical protein
MKTLVSAAAVAAIAGSAFGLGETLDLSSIPIYTVNTPGVTITKMPLDQTGRGALGAFTGVPSSSVYGWDDNTYNTGHSGSVAAPASSGVIGLEDYGTTLDPSGPPTGSPTTDYTTFNCNMVEFAGGVDTTNGVLFFEYFYNDGTLANSFGIQFGTVGNYVWALTFGGSGEIAIPTEGYMRIETNNNPNIAPSTNGQWFLSDAGANPVFGYNDLTVDAGQFDYGTSTAPNVQDIGYRFALGQVPTPGAAGLLGLAGLAGVSRRRRR